MDGHCYFSLLRWVALVLNDHECELVKTCFTVVRLSNHTIHFSEKVNAYEYFTTLLCFCGHRAFI